jgi:RNA polymerase sigma-70 factor (ECF subfamily)
VIAMVSPGANVDVVDSQQAAAWQDSDLVTMIRGGGDAGREAERTLCQRYGRRIFLYGVRHLRDEDEARELIQQVLVVALESIRAGKVEQPDRLASFILGTCRFVVWDRRRGDQRRQEIAAEAAADLPLTVEPDWERVDVPRLLQCLGTLPTRELTVVRMTYNEDLSAEEIGAVLALEPGNVRVIRHRALRRLQTCLGEEGAQ